jgi:hypothetical protein
MLSLYVKYQALLNALEMSQNTKQFASLFSNEFKMLLYISNNWYTVKYLGRKVDCYSYISLF